MMRRIHPVFCAVLLALPGACASGHGPGAPLTASRETPTEGRRSVDAHDIALWTGRETTLAGVRTTGFMVLSGASGLDVRNHDGALLQHIPDRSLGDIDLASLPTGDSHFTVLGSSYRAPRERGVVLFRFDNVAGGAFRRWGTVRTDIGRPKGFCLRQWRGAVHAIVTGADGEVRGFALAEAADGSIDAREVRRFRLGSSASGCAIDAAGGRLYITEERRGVWRYPLDPASTEAPILIQAVDRVRLTAPVRGVAVLDDRGRYLVASSRGDSSLAVWDIGDAPVWLGRFIVRRGAGIDEVRGTTGLDAYGGGFGGLDRGVVALQDSDNEGGSNFKLVDWGDIRRALGLGESPPPAPTLRGPANIPPSEPSGSD